MCDAEVLRGCGEVVQVCSPVGPRECTWAPEAREAEFCVATVAVKGPLVGLGCLFMYTWYSQEWSLSGACVPETNPLLLRACGWLSEHPRADIYGEKERVYVLGISISWLCSPAQLP